MSAGLVVTDPVPRDAPGAREIGFAVPERYNASAILFDNLERGFGARPALHHAGGTVTYIELCAEAARAGRALAAEGLVQGDRVLMLLDDTPAYPAAFFGAVRAGFVPVLVNVLSLADLVAYFLADSAAPVAVVEAALLPVLRAALRDRAPALRRVVVANGDAPDDLAVPAAAWRDWLRPHAPRLDAAPTGRDDMAFWMYSSGSTGRPKGVVHLQHDMLYTQLSYARAFLALGPDDICFSVPKIFFAYGFGNSVTFPFAVGASAVLLAGRPEPAGIFAAIERHRPTVFFGLPTLYNALVAHPGSAERDLSSLRLCISAAETLPAETFATWRDRYGQAIVEGLGSTEVLHIYLSNPADAPRAGSAGQRVPGYEIRLVDPEGRDVEGPGAGTMWVRGDSQAPTYWNRPESTAATMRGDWIHTGDRFRRDADGYYWFEGRADDLVKVSGQWVHPMEIELCLAGHPDVHECAVLAVAAASGLTTIRAFVVARAGAATDAAATRALQDWVKARLLPYKYPREVVWVPDLPKTGTGKIDRQALKAHTV
ncbi:MAG: benzoate-CoA ligase family protein [Alphaproteobacteria bacterium]